MLKKILLLLFVAVFACGVASTALATPWSQSFNTTNMPNLLNLWISPTSSFIGGSATGWGYWQSDDGLWAQLFTQDDYGQSITRVTLQFGTAKSVPFYLDAQEVYYDWDTGVVDAGYNFSLYWTGTKWDYPNAFGQNTGALVDCPPPITAAVPEPATMLLLGSGLIGLAAVGRRKFFKK